MNADMPPKRRRGRPRREGADEEILTVALELLREIGYRDFNVDTVAERAGVSKTTVYRRWPTKAALVAAAIEKVTAPPAAPPDSGSVENDVMILLRDASAVLAEIGPFQPDPELIELVRATIASRRARIQQVLERAGTVDAPLVADLLAGPLWTRAFAADAQFDDDLPLTIVARARPLLGK